MLSAKNSAFSMPEKPAPWPRLMTMTFFALSTFEDRHAVDRARLVGARHRVDDVVGADDQRHVGGLELGVDLVQVGDQVVRHAGLGEQHVHVAGHAAGHRMDRELHLHAALDQQLAQLPHLVLRLRDRHAVAGHDR